MNKNERLEELVKDPTRLQWSDVENFSYQDLSGRYDAHVDIMDKADYEQLSKIVHMHAVQLGDDAVKAELAKAHVFKYLQAEAEKGRVNDLLLHQLSEMKDQMLYFQRERYFPTNKVRKGTGRFVESVMIFPNNVKIRTFRSTFRDDDETEKAWKGQEFHNGLVGFIKEKFERENLGQSEQYVADRIALCDPEMPLDSNAYAIEFAFIDGNNMMQLLANASTEERIAKLKQVLDIDLITSYYANEYEATKEGKGIAMFRDHMNCFMKANRFEGKDTKDEVIEEIILEADKHLKHKYEISLTFTKKMLHRLPAIQDIIDFMDLNDTEPEQEIAFSEKDVNLGNVMHRNGTGTRYTYIDFERARKEHYMAKLAGRIILSGVLDKDGKSIVMEDGRTAEQQLLDSSYKTLLKLAAVDDKGWDLDRETFDKAYARYRKRWLLRAARRFKNYSSDEDDADKAKSYMKFYYKAFVNQLVDEGKVETPLDERLGYLNGLFGEPIGELPEFTDEYDPSFRNIDHFKPSGASERAKERNERMIEKQISKVKWAERKTTIGVGLIIAVGMGVALSIVGYQEMKKKHDKEQKEAAAKLTKERKNRQYSYYIDVIADEFGGFQHVSNRTTKAKFRLYEKQFGDKKTALCALLNYDITIDAARAAGYEDQLEKEKGHIPYSAIKPYLKELDEDLYYHVDGIDGYVDGFMRHISQNAEYAVNSARIKKRKKDKKRKKKYGASCVPVATPFYAQCIDETNKKCEWIGNVRKCDKPKTRHYIKPALSKHHSRHLDRRKR